MKIIRRTAQFKRDFKRMKRRGKDLSRIKEIVQKVAAGEPLDPKHRDHPLSGGYRDARECHIRADWLLIYERSESEIVLIRTGTHSDLFE